MRIKSTIEELEYYLSLYPAQSKRKPICVALKDNPISNPARHISFLNEPERQYGSIWEQLEHMDEDSLDQLIDEHGEESPLGQAIRRKRADTYSRISCNWENIGTSLQQEIKKAQAEGNSFYQTICFHIDRLGYKSDADFYNSINMPRQQFSRLRDASNTLSKKTVLWIIVALRLDYDQACDLLQKAGYRFRKGDMRDVILSYIFRNTTYDLYEVNQVLDHFGIAPLG